jgi:tetratricopeptide (TPR) repeat protein
MRELATLEVHAGSPAADGLSAEALALGQDLVVDDAALAGLFTTRGICHGHAGRKPEAAAYFREAARLAGRADDSLALGRALLNLADAVTGADPATGAEAARAATAQLRRAGARTLLGAAVENLPQTLKPSRKPRCAVVNSIVYAPATGRLAGLPFGAVTPDGSLGLKLDIFGEIGQDVAGPDSTFATVLAEVTVSGKNLRRARSLAAQVLRQPPRILLAGD